MASRIVSTLCACALAAGLLAEPSWAELTDESLLTAARTSTGETVSLYGRTDATGAACLRVDAPGVPAPGDLGCAASPATQENDVRGLAVVPQPPFFFGPTVTVTRVTGATAALQLDGDRVLPSVPIPGSASRVVLAVFNQPVPDGVVAALDATGRLRAVANHARFSADPGGRVSVGGGAAEAATFVDVRRSVAEGRLVTRPIVCFGWYVYRAPRRGMQCFERADTGPRLAGPVSRPDIYGPLVTGRGPAGAATVEILDAQRRTFLRSRVTRLPSRLGGGTAFIVRGATPAGAYRAVLRDARGRALVVRAVRGQRVPGLVDEASVAPLLRPGPR